MPVTHEEIAILAYNFWKERGEPQGSPEVDWERAEATLQLKAINLVQSALHSDTSTFDQQMAAPSRDDDGATVKGQDQPATQAYTDRPVESARLSEPVESEASSESSQNVEAARTTRGRRKNAPPQKKATSTSKQPPA